MNFYEANQGFYEIEMGFYDIGARVYEMDERVYGWCHWGSRCSCCAIVHRLLMRNWREAVCNKAFTDPWCPCIWHLVVRLGHASSAIATRRFCTTRVFMERGRMSGALWCDR